MNVEVEIKIEINNFDEIKTKVAAIGKLIKSIKQVDDYFVPSHRDFFAQKPHPTEWLRIRTNPDKVIFEYDKSINKKESGEQECAEEYESEINGTFGDVANIGKTRYGGAIQAAVFLWQFIKNPSTSPEQAYPWVHIDIAPRMTSIEGEYLAKGSAGAGIGLLARFLSNFK